MLSLGYQLYQLGERDDLTVQLEPLFRRVPFSLGVGVSAAALGFDWPRDRALYLSAVHFIFNAEPGTTWTAGSVLLSGFTLCGQSNAAGLGFGGAPSGAGGAGSFTQYPAIILPAGSSAVLNVARIGAAAIATGEVDVAAFLIPPGTMTRGFS